MVLVSAANSPDSVDGLSVANVTAECVAGIGRVCDYAPAFNDAPNHCDAPWLRIRGVHFDEFSHARIVGEQWLRGYPHNTLLFAATFTAHMVLMNLLFEFLPLILFLVALFTKGMYTAVAVLMVAMPVGFLIKYLRTKKFDKMYFGSTVLLLIAGSLTLYFRNPVFVTWKPSVFYWEAGISFLGSQFLSDKPLAQRFFGLVDGMSFTDVTPGQWKQLNIAWVLFFALAGVLNLYVAYNYSFETWATFKVFGLMALTFIFIVGQTIWISGLVGDEDANEQQEPD